MYLIFLLLHVFLCLGYSSCEIINLLYVWHPCEKSMCEVQPWIVTICKASSQISVAGIKEGFSVQELSTAGWRKPSIFKDIYQWGKNIHPQYLS